MNTSRRPFFFTILLNFGWIAFNSFYSLASDTDAAAFVLVGPSFLSLVAYQVFLSRKEQLLSQREIDSAYYLGFLITLMVLAAAALQISSYSADDANNSLVTAIGLKFALGLLATGYGLFARIWLQARLMAPDDATEVIEAYIDRIGRLNDRIDNSAQAIDGLVGEVLQNAVDASRKASNSVVATLGEELEPATKQLSTAIKHLHEAAGTLASGPITRLSDLAAEVSTGFRALGEDVPKVSSSLHSLDKHARGTAEAQDELAKSTLAAGELIGGLKAQLHSLGVEAQPASDGLRELGKTVGRTNSALLKTPAATEALETQLHTALAAMQEMAASTATLVGAISTYQQTLNVAPIKSFEAAIAATTRETTQLGTGLSELESRASAVGVSFAKDIGQSVKDMTALADSMSSTSRQLGDAMQQLAKAIRDAAQEALK